jgi:hypothetical protein
MLGKIINALRLRSRRKRYRVGATIVLWPAKDIRRDIEVVEASEVDEGFVTARVRTWNVLYATKGVSIPEFSEPRRLKIDELLGWKGAPWGGPVPPES